MKIHNIWHMRQVCMKCMYLKGPEKNPNTNYSMAPPGDFQMHLPYFIIETCHMTHEELPKTYQRASKYHGPKRTEVYHLGLNV